MTLELRGARPDDADALTALFQAARTKAMPYLPQLHTREETRWWMEHVVLTSRDVTVALLKGEISGFAAMHGNHLDHLYVSPELQHKGIGSRLIEHLKATHGASLSLYVFQKNAVARSFYENHGFACAAFGDGSGNEENEPDAIYLLRGGTDT